MTDCSAPPYAHCWHPASPDEAEGARRALVAHAISRGLSYPDPDMVFHKCCREHCRVIRPLVDENPTTGPVEHCVRQRLVVAEKGHEWRDVCADAIRERRDREAVTLLFQHSSDGISHLGTLIGMARSIHREATALLRQLRVTRTIGEPPGPWRVQINDQERLILGIRACEEALERARNLDDEIDVIMRHVTGVNMPVNVPFTDPLQPTRLRDVKDEDADGQEPQLRVDANWFANRLLELIVPNSELALKLRDMELVSGANPLGHVDHGRIRFSPELDSFEFLNHMIPRDHLPSVVSMMLRALDDADQALFECPECKQSKGFFLERGFQRCNDCGYPGQ